MRRSEQYEYLKKACKSKESWVEISITAENYREISTEHTEKGSETTRILVQREAVTQIKYSFVGCGKNMRFLF